MKSELSPLSAARVTPCLELVCVCVYTTMETGFVLGAVKGPLVLVQPASSSSPPAADPEHPALQCPCGKKAGLPVTSEQRVFGQQNLLCCFSNWQSLAFFPASLVHGVVTDISDDDDDDGVLQCPHFNALLLGGFGSLPGTSVRKVQRNFPNFS